MANIKSAKKRARQAVKHNELNSSQRSEMRTAEKALRKIIAGGDVKAAADLFRQTASILDKSARKGLIHKNTAARKKSRLNAQIKKLAGKK